VELMPTKPGKSKRRVGLMPENPSRNQTPRGAEAHKSEQKSTTAWG